MQSESNSAVNRLKGARSAGISCQSTSESIDDHRVVGDGVPPQIAAEEQRFSTSARKKRKLEESEETKYLSSNELQRMVLLKQLRVLELRKRFVL